MDPPILTPTFRPPSYKGDVSINIKVGFNEFPISAKYCKYNNPKPAIILVVSGALRSEVIV
jgi:hypothetical protein